jgi:hypothetical protein
LPDTGAGGTNTPASDLIMPVAALGAAALIGARHLRSTEHADTNA